MPGNRIIALLSDHDRQTVLNDSVRIFLPLKKQLYARGQPIDAVYFPIDCVVSIVTGAGEEPEIEMATIGNEGVVGISCMLDTNRAISNNVVQIAGEALRLDIRLFDKYVQENAAFRKLMHKYLYALMHEIMQAGACNQLHSAEERCARWLLMMHDRSGNNSFCLTQEFLSEMLGVRRATVNLAIGMFKTAGLITYVRGRMTILDRAGLESVSCPCYELIEREFRQLRLDSDA